MPRIPAIETHNLCIGYPSRAGERIVHPDLDLKLFAGEVTALLGRNGAGKSTLLRTLCGLQPALSGRILIDGRLLANYTPGELSAKVGIVLTERTHAGGITVYELVSLGRYPHTGFFGTLGESDHEAIRQAIQSVGLSDKQHRFVAELSDGERQKAFIAKALAQECPIILLDEPTAFLDITSRIETMVTLRTLAHEQHKAVLLSTHDLDTALQLADRLWLQPACDPTTGEAGPMVCGTTEELVADGSLSRFFGSDTLTFDPATRRLIARNGK